MAIFDCQRWMNTNIWGATHQYISTWPWTWDVEQQDTHLSCFWIGACPKELHHYRNMTEEYQITIEIEEPQTPAKAANNPIPLHFGDKCQAIVVQEDGCPYNQRCERKSRRRHHEIDRAQHTEGNNFKTLADIPMIRTQKWANRHFSWHAVGLQANDLHRYSIRNLNSPITRLQAL